MRVQSQHLGGNVVWAVGAGVQAHLYREFESSLGDIRLSNKKKFLIKNFPLCLILVLFEPLVLK